MLFWKLYIILSSCFILVCINAECQAPNKCECKPGYYKTSNGTCSLPEQLKTDDNRQPTCSHDCLNGVCLNGVCSCPNNFLLQSLNSKEICLPKCLHNKDCSNGLCSSKGVCNCLQGFELSNITLQCEQQPAINESNCEKTCVNGECVAPDNCKCFEGYRNVSANLCMPVCKSGCPNGECVAPEICECNNGYAMQDNKCEPICLEKCINAVCRDPNKCECKPGYYKTSNGTCSHNAIQAADKISPPTKTWHIVVPVVFLVMLVISGLWFMYRKFGKFSFNLRDLVNKFNDRHNPHTQLYNEEIYNDVYLL